ncbi:unnamed protein product [Gongylonema pulchrum]|uniref:Transposase n=1 Tax=Gongylonema pulchrum TaxID=637853 RepID=A0A183DM70_9BILA|nr:unnamed protein product [Gongylonema pulchrum]
MQASFPQNGTQSSGTQQMKTHKKGVVVSGAFVIPKQKIRKLERQITLYDTAPINGSKPTPEKPVLPQVVERWLIGTGLYGLA